MAARNFDVNTKSKMPNRLTPKSTENNPAKTRQPTTMECSYEKLCGRCRYCSNLQRLFSAAALESSDLAVHDVGSVNTHFSSSFKSELVNQINVARSFDWSSVKRSGEHI